MLLDMKRLSRRAEIRRRLRMQRTNLDLSQIDVAMKSDLSESRYWRIENGYDEATPDERGAIAKTLKTTEAELFDVQSDEAVSA